MAQLVGLAALGIRRVRARAVATHRRLMLIAGSLVVAFLVSYGFKLYLLGREQLDVWQPVYRHTLRFHETCVLVMVLAVLFDAPLHEVANPTVTPNPEKAPWYFAGLQELLARFHPLIAGFLVPAGILIGLALLPYLDRSPYIQARHRKVAVATFTTFTVILVTLTIIGFAFRGPNWGWVWPWQDWYGAF